jgi:uncharacterized membrane protein YoaK (UPF0700 family)
MCAHVCFAQCSLQGFPRSRQDLLLAIQIYHEKIMAVSVAELQPVALRTAAVLMVAALVITPPAAQACSSTGAIVGAQQTSFSVPLLANDSSAYVRYDVSKLHQQLYDHCNHCALP